MGYDAVNSYKQNAIMTASPDELTLMLYDGAVKFMNIAKEKMKGKDIEAIHSSLIRAQDIISELDVTLDMQYEVSQTYRNLYQFIEEKLLEANMQKSPEPLEEAIRVTTMMRDLWKDTMKAYREELAKAR